MRHFIGNLMVVVLVAGLVIYGIGLVPAREPIATVLRVTVGALALFLLFALALPLLRGE